MNKSSKNIYLYILFASASFAFFLNLDKVGALLEALLALLFPIMLGILLAFILSVPTKGIENYLMKFLNKRKIKYKEATLDKVSYLITLIIVLAILTLTSIIIIPNLSESFVTIFNTVTKKLPEWTAWLAKYNIDISGVSEFMESFDINNIFGDFGNMISQVWQRTSSALSFTVNILFAIVIASYILLSRKALGRQVKKLVYANIRKDRADRIYYIANLINDSYSKFLRGQAAEASILGFLIFLGYAIFGMPYAMVIGFLTFLFAFVPYVGAFASCFIGVIMILATEPEKAIWAIIIYSVIQFCENQFIYPNVVGASVGLSPFWTLISAMVGGKLFGLPGIVLFIPLAAVIYTLLQEYTNKKLKEKEIEL